MRAGIFAAPIACALLLLSSSAAPSTHTQDALRDGFRNPPESAKPRVWWHWMNGNVTKEGIRLDLEWMKRVGIGGMNAIDASIDTPQVVKNRLVYMTPGWKDAFRYAAGLADSMGMELSIDSSPGWSETGGPWVPPAQAMKKLVWSATSVNGPFHGVLPRPPDVPGPFGTLRLAASHAPDFYRDSIVIAYRAPPDPAAASGVSSNAGTLDAASLADGDLTNGALLKPKSSDADVWIAFSYKQLTRFQGATLALSTNAGEGFDARIEASDDGVHWRKVADVPPAAQIHRFTLAQQTISFPPVTARHFRLVLRPGPPIPPSLRIVERAPGAIVATPPPVSGPRVYHVQELVFHAAATVNEFEKKAGFAIARDNYAIDSTPQFAPGTAIDPAQVMVLTGMRPDGSLDWTPPPGHWVVLRMGYSLTGTENHPATAEATGLEVDKLDAGAVRSYIDHYLDLYKSVTGPALFGAHGLKALTVDSTEIGAQNWTPDMLADFQRLRGYDPRPWLPALTGAVVRSPADSDKFLWDFRRTIAQLLAANHYGVIGEVARANGLINYGEALEDRRPSFGDDMAMRQHTSIPMGAMWTYVSHPAATYIADLRGAASVAHVYGQNLVAAESLTSAGQPWAYAPRGLKPIVDLEFALGVNRVVIHTSVHQPVDRPPGLSLFQYGQFFNRLESWAEEAGPWVTYIARCSYLLQQGHAAVDTAYFYGEEAPITGLFGDKLQSDIPPGYGFDFVDADALAHRLSVDQGDLVTASGMRYRLLYLGGSSNRMTLATLRRLQALVEQGAMLVGTRPISSPSLADDPVKFAAAADALFRTGAYGKGRVFAALAEAVAALHLPPDFSYSKPHPDTELLSLHRRLPEGDLYFVSNRRDRPETVTANFRVAKGVPELWDAVSGEIHRADVTRHDGQSAVTLKLPPYGSVFVLFRAASDAPMETIAAAKTVTTLNGPWRIAFQPDRGAPAEVTQTALQSWSASKIPGVRYFSGTGSYTTSFNLPKVTPGARLWLDLGDVRELASVSLNGKDLGIVWTPPFRLDITGAAKPGRNVLAVKVTNLWVNRLIGDAQAGAHPYTFTTIPTYRADAPLRESGLLGPVQVREAQ